MDVLFRLLAALGALVVALFGLLVFVAWRFHRAEKAAKRAHQDERIAQAIREASVEGATAGDSVWRHFVTDHRLNGRTPEEWKP